MVFFNVTVKADEPVALPKIPVEISRQDNYEIRLMQMRAQRQGLRVSFKDAYEIWKAKNDKDKKDNVNYKDEADKLLSADMGDCSRFLVNTRRLKYDVQSDDETKNMRGRTIASQYTRQN